MNATHAMRSGARRWIMISTAAIAIVAAVIIMLWRQHDRAGLHPVSVTDEHAAAEALLAAKLSGAGYFIAEPNTQPEEGVLWIGVDDALKQVPRIIAQRKLVPEAEKTIGKLIDTLSEPHPFRTVGGKRVNLSRLNLSLDSIK